jgi:hypothetical protein
MGCLKTAEFSVAMAVFRLRRHGADEAGQGGKVRSRTWAGVRPTDASAVARSFGVRGAKRNAATGAVFWLGVAKKQRGIRMDAPFDHLANAMIIAAVVAGGSASAG